MFVGFNLDDLTEYSFSDYLEAGKLYFEERKSKLESASDSLDKYMCENGLDADIMQKQWFPEVHADIFISHSHDDKDLAVSLAGWLHKKFDLDVFVDSMIWEYANNLLKKVDNRYCVQTKDGNHTTYSYSRRNRSTSHVHMMLMTALANMIEKSECLFFLHTTNSSPISDIIEERTESPWIYAELALSRIIRPTMLSRERVKNILHYEPKNLPYGIILEHADEKEYAIPIWYKLPVNHLQSLSSSDLNDWEESSWQDVPKSVRQSQGWHPLNGLYRLKKVFDSRKLFDSHRLFR